MRLEETAYKKTSQTSSLKERLWTRASKVEKKKYAFTCVSHVATVYTGHCIVKIEVGVGSVGLNSTKESIQEINIIKLPLENMAKRILFFEGLKELIRDTTFGVLRLSRCAPQKRAPSSKEHNLRSVEPSIPWCCPLFTQIRSFLPCLYISLKTFFC